MHFTTPVDIPPSDWKINPCERMLFVGSCFADNMGKRFEQEKFRCVVNPFGVMYNPASILHTVQRLASTGSLPFAADQPGTAVFTLGTNHVYILKETGEIVDNCRKRPQQLFQERTLTVDQCAGYIDEAISLIHTAFPLVRFILTVSPIRYRKYGFHGSQLSKSALLLAVDQCVRQQADKGAGHAETTYFPSYEIVNDELRDYRFYQPDMIHPSPQAVDYIYERMAQTFFSPATVGFLQAWKPIREALAHKPFDAQSAAYQDFLGKTKMQARALQRQYPDLHIDF